MEREELIELIRIELNAYGLSTKFIPLEDSEQFKEVTTMAQVGILKLLEEEIDRAVLKELRLLKRFYSKDRGEFKYVINQRIKELLLKLTK